MNLRKGFCQRLLQGRASLDDLVQAVERLSLPDQLRESYESIL
jgi:hypothetical protein